jgi:glutamine synthetase
MRMSLGERELQATADALTQRGIDVVRVAYADLIGTERGRDILVRRLASTAGHGVAFCRTVYGTSPLGDVIDIKHDGLAAGLPDMLARPDLATLRDLPWEPGVAHALADALNPDGTMAAEGPRQVLRAVADRFAELGLCPVIGPELEFFLLEEDPASPSGWRRYGEAAGNVYVAGRKGDPEGTLQALQRRGRFRLPPALLRHRQRRAECLR